MPEEEGEEYLSEQGIFFRGFLVWITFPPMLLLILDEPVLVVITYASLGALFMPFLAGTLLWLMNRRVPREFRNGLLTNIILGALRAAVYLRRYPGDPRRLAPVITVFRNFLKTLSCGSHRN